MNFSRSGNRFSASVDGVEVAFIDADEPSPASLRIKHTEVAKGPDYQDLVSAR